MKKQLLLAMMLFAFVFPPEIAEAKNADFSNFVKAQSTTQTGQSLIARWRLSRRQKKKRVVKRRGLGRFNLRRLSPRRFMQRWVRRKKK